MDITSCIETLLRDGFILVFNQDKLDVVKTAQALIEAGVNNMEVTCRIKDPLGKISRLREALPGFRVGAASMIDFPSLRSVYNRCRADDSLPAVREAVEVGAEFLVSAVNFSEATYHELAGKLPIIPGCGTTTEIISQFDQGANLCKIFPAQWLGGPGFVRAIDPAIHKCISLVPTGGTNIENMADYIAAGVLVLGGSFSMIDKAVMGKIIAEQDYKLLAGEFTKIKRHIDTCRARQWPDLDFSRATVEEISAGTGRIFNI